MTLTLLMLITTGFLTNNSLTLSTGAITLTTYTVCGICVWALCGHNDIDAIIYGYSITFLLAHGAAHRTPPRCSHSQRHHVCQVESACVMGMPQMCLMRLSPNLNRLCLRTGAPENFMMLIIIDNSL